MIPYHNQSMVSYASGDFDPHEGRGSESKTGTWIIIGAMAAAAVATAIFVPLSLK